ncbi:hypothetical protein GQ42DRAFT_165227, partial [Ramicandelaber brevisporus]
MTTDDQRQQAKGGGESQRKRDEPRGRGIHGTDGTCRWENPDASHTNLAAEGQPPQGPNTAPAHASTWDSEGTTP